MQFTSVSPSLKAYKFAPPGSPPTSWRLNEFTTQTLSQASLDRAVLFLEFPPSILQSLLQYAYQSEQTVFTTPSSLPQSDVLRIGLSGLQALQVQLRATVSPDELSDRTRYLPPSAPPSSQEYRRAAHEARPSSWSWLEYVAAGGSPTGSSLAIMADMNVFREHQRSTTRSRSEARIFTFDEICQASGCPYLARHTVLDETRPTRRASDMTPLQSIKAASDTLPTAVWCPAFRFLGHVEEMARIRLLFASVARSWRSTASAWRAYDLFMATFHPYEPQFPVRLGPLTGLAGHFRQGSTFKKYVQHLRKAHRILDAGPMASDDIVRDICRGVSRDNLCRERVIYRGFDTLRLAAYFDQHRLEYMGDLVAVCYTFALRAQSEGFPLQADGRVHWAWHSYVRLGENSATVVLRVRKNSPHKVSTIKRLCSCSAAPRICGVCVLKKLCATTSAPDARLFTVSVSAATPLLNQATSSVGLPQGGWHGFRRGYASDLLSAGSPLALIMSAGGWSSASFLRYLKPSEVDAQRSLNLAFDGSDSD